MVLAVQARTQVEGRPRLLGGRRTTSGLHLGDGERLQWLLLPPRAELQCTVRHHPVSTGIGLLVCDRGM